MLFIILENYDITVGDGRAYTYASCVAACVYIAVGQETQGLELFYRMPFDALQFTGKAGCWKITESQNVRG